MYAYINTYIHTNIHIHTYRSIVLYLFTYVHPYIHTGTFELLFRTTTTSAASSLLSVRGKIDGESCCKDVKAAAIDWSLIHIDYIFIHTLIHTYIYIKSAPEHGRPQQATTITTADIEGRSLYLRVFLQVEQVFFSFSLSSALANCAGKPDRERSAC